MAGSFSIDSAGRLTVTAVDVGITSDVPGTGATNLGKAEDAAHSSGDVGVAALTKRTDAAASSAGTDGDYATLNSDATGKLWVTGTYAEDAAHTDADKGIFALTRRIDTAASSAGTSGDYAALNTDALGKLWVSGAYAEDAASASADLGIQMLAVRQAAPTDLSAGNTDGDYEPLQVDAIGRLWVRAARQRGQFQPSIAVSTSPAYSSSDVVGGIITVSNFALISGSGGTIDQVTVFDAANQKAALSILFFKATPASGTYTDNGALAYGAGDPANLIGAVNIATADYTTLSSKAVASKSNLNIPLQVAATSLFMLIVTTGTPTYAATTDLSVVLGVHY